MSYLLYDDMRGFFLSKKIDLFYYSVLFRIVICTMGNSNTTLDLSLIFNEHGYIDWWNQYSDKYVNNNKIKNITLIQSNDSPIKIGNNFLRGCENLISINIIGSVNIVAIGDNFLYGCEKIIKFNTKELTTLTYIGDYFLGGCTNLTNFNTNGLISLTTISTCFLLDCKNLTNFDTTGLISLTTIGDFFLKDCENLTDFNTKGLKSLVAIDKCFLSGCTKLTTFDTEGLVSLTTIKDNFLYHCNENLIVMIKNPPICLRKILLQMNYKIIKLYDKPCIYLNNNCII